MRAYKFIQAAECAGCIMEAEGEDIRVMNIDSLPIPLREKIKDNKRIILDALIRDNQARGIGFMIGVPGDVYFCSLNRTGVVYIEKIGDSWEAYSQTHLYTRYGSVNIKLLYVDSSFEHVLLKAKGYLVYGQRVSK